MAVIDIGNGLSLIQKSIEFCQEFCAEYREEIRKSGIRTSESSGLVRLPNRYGQQDKFRGCRADCEGNEHYVRNGTPRLPIHFPMREETVTSADGMSLAYERTEVDNHSFFSPI